MRVLRNALVLEGEEMKPVLTNILVRDGEISLLKSLPKKGSSIDLKRSIVLPPFVNSHTHVGDSPLKEKYLGKTQEETVGPGGVKYMEPKQDRREAMKGSLRRMLESGTLAHCDFREGGLKGVELLREVSLPHLRSIILGRPNGDSIEEVLKVSDGLGMPSLDYAERFGKIRVPEGKYLSVHVAETREAERLSREKTGKGEMERALELEPSFLVHGTWSTAEDFEELAKRKIPIVFCPRSNHLLSCGSPPINLAITKGTTFFLGTDNVMVCDPNLFTELSFAWALVRRDNPRAGEEEVLQLLKAATVKPAEFFALPWGPIEDGSPATFIVLGGLSDVENPHAAIVNRAGRENLRLIFLDGVPILRF